MAPRCAQRKRCGAPVGCAPARNVARKRATYGRCGRKRTSSRTYGAWVGVVVALFARATSAATAVAVAGGSISTPGTFRFR